MKNHISLGCLLALLGAITASGCAASTGEEVGVAEEPALTSNALTSNALTSNALTSNALTSNALTSNALTSNALTSNALTSNALTSNGLKDPNSQEVMYYIVGCALPAGAEVVTPEQTYQGELGLAPEWGLPGGQCDQDCQQWVSACVLARVDFLGVHVEISVRGASPALATSAAEQAAYPDREAAYFGNIFGATQQRFACLPPARRRTRACAGLQSWAASCPSPLPATRSVLPRPRTEPTATAWMPSAAIGGTGGPFTRSRCICPEGATAALAAWDGSEQHGRPMVLRFVALGLAVAGLGCNGIGSYTTAAGESYCGAVTQTATFRAGLAEGAQMRVTLDAAELDGELSPGFVSTSEPARQLLVGAPLRRIPALENDALAVPDLGGGRVQTRLFALTPAPAGEDPLLGVLSLRSDDGDRGAAAPARPRSRRDAGASRRAAAALRPLRPLPAGGYVRVLGVETSCDETAAAVVTEAGRGALRRGAEPGRAARPLRRRRAGDRLARSRPRHPPGDRGGAGARRRRAGRGRRHRGHLAPGPLRRAPRGPASGQGARLGDGKAAGGGRPPDRAPARGLPPPARTTPPSARREYPFIALLASGGHTAIYRVDGPRLDSIRELGATRDDAAGEAFDKVAKLLGLGYPGGPHVDRLAAQGDATRARSALPRPMARRDSLEFSFSGVKTAVARHVAAHGVPAGEALADLCAAFQETMVEALVTKTLRAAQREGLARIVLAGGVAANRGLRARMGAECARRGASLHVPPLASCTDNAAMIAYAGALRLAAGERDGMDLAPSTRTALLRVTRKGGGRR